MPGICEYYKIYGYASALAKVHRPSPCDCQSCKDSAKSLEITKNHVPGRWCKNRNQCSICCEIKHYFRILKHFGGTCSPKKCPVCEWARHPEQRFMVIVQERTLGVLVKRLYYLMLMPHDRRLRW